MTQRTFAIIKPDAMMDKNAGKIIDIIEKNGFKILKLNLEHLSKNKAEEFYAVHKEKPFFNELMEYVTSGPIISMVLEKENAIADWRNLMGPTDSKIAPEGTIRNLFGTSKSINAVHGSDSPENAEKEINIFYPE